MKKILQYALIVTGISSAIPAMSQMSNMAEKAAEQLKLLLQFKGLWEAGSAVMKTGGKEYRFAYYADFKPASANNAIVMHEWADIPDVGKLDGNNLAGVNLQDGKIHWFSVDNMGTTHEHVGEFAGRHHFTMVYTSMQEGKKFVETLEIEFAGPDVLILKQTSMLGGEEVVLVTGTFHRKKD